MQTPRDGGRDATFGRSPSWLALAAVLALHGAGIAALFHSRGPPDARGDGTAIVVRLLETPRPASTPTPAASARPAPKARARPVRPATVAPAIAAEPAAPGAAMSAPAPHALARGRDDSLSAYAALVWQRIAAHRRPGPHRSGTVLIAFRLDRQGTLLALSVVRSSGDALLDAVALAAVRAAAPFPPPPAGLDGEVLAFAIPFAFS